MNWYKHQQSRGVSHKVTWTVSSYSKSSFRRRHRAFTSQTRKKALCLFLIIENHLKISDVKNTKLLPCSSRSRQSNMDLLGLNPKWQKTSTPLDLQGRISFPAFLSFYRLCVYICSLAPAMFHLQSQKWLVEFLSLISLNHSLL
jgi:hypothetical protein